MVVHNFESSGLVGLRPIRVIQKFDIFAKFRLPARVFHMAANSGSKVSSFCKTFLYSVSTISIIKLTTLRFPTRVFQDLAKSETLLFLPTRVFHRFANDLKSLRLPTRVFQSLANELKLSRSRECCDFLTNREIANFREARNSSKSIPDFFGFSGNDRFLINLESASFLKSSSSNSSSLSMSMES